MTGPNPATHPTVARYKRINIGLFFTMFLLCGSQTLLLLNAELPPPPLPVYPVLIVALLACAWAATALSAIRLSRHRHPLGILAWICTWELAGWGLSYACGAPFGAIRFAPGSPVTPMLIAGAIWLAILAFCQWQLLWIISRKPLTRNTWLGLSLVTCLLNTLLLAGTLPAMTQWPGFVRWNGELILANCPPAFLLSHTLWLFFVLLLGALLFPQGLPIPPRGLLDPTPFAVMVALALPVFVVTLRFALGQAAILSGLGLLLSLLVPSLLADRPPQNPQGSH